MSPLERLLRRHREQARLTQEELADRAGVSTRTISDIERGVRARAYADTATRLSVAYVPIGVDRDLPDHDELGSVVTDRLENSHRDPSRLPLR
jgi:transcriptional regulator with XRE-family HTH domain